MKGGGCESEAFIMSIRSVTVCMCFSVHKWQKNEKEVEVKGKKNTENKHKGVTTRNRADCNKAKSKKRASNTEKA